MIDHLLFVGFLHPFFLTGHDQDLFIMMDFVSRDFYESFLLFGRQIFGIVDIKIQFCFCFPLVDVLASFPAAFGEMKIDFLIHNSIDDFILVHSRIMTFKE